MDEYIEREATIELLRSIGSRDYRREKGTIQEAIKMISFSEYTPATDVVEVRHGRWICINKRYGEYECSVCHGMDSNCSDYYGIHAVTEQEFCPSCGAKMGKEVADETCICQP